MDRRVVASWLFQPVVQFVWLRAMTDQLTSSKTKPIS